MESKQTPTGATLIAAERARQITGEHYVPEHDDAYTDGQLVKAAISYAGATLPPGSPRVFPPEWPWHERRWKPKSPIDALTKAGALIAAEIDRRLREEARHG